MAVPKTTQTRYMDGRVQATQMTTQVTPSLHHFSFLLSAQSSFQYSDNKALIDTRSIFKNDVGMGLLCSHLCCCTRPSIYLVCVVFGTAIPTSLYIFGKCFSYLFVCLFVVPHYHTRDCLSLSSAPTPLVCMYVSVFVEKGLSPSSSKLRR